MNTRLLIRSGADGGEGGGGGREILSRVVAWARGRGVVGPRCARPCNVPVRARVE